MGLYLSTDITGTQTIAAGGTLIGNLVTNSPSGGYFYLAVEQFTSTLVPIPGSRAFLYQAVEGGPFINSTVNYSVDVDTGAGTERTKPMALTVLNTDCYQHVFMKKITSVVPAGLLVIGNTYKILVLGTTDFTLIGATSNTVGTVFVATGVGAGTGIACLTPDPDVDETVDYVSIILQSAAVPSTGLDLGAIMNLMLTIMIIGMMMKMMMSSVKG